MLHTQTGLAIESERFTAIHLEESRVSVRSHWRVGLLFGAIALVASTASAQLLPERLVPPQQFSIPSLPMIDQPAMGLRSGADKVAGHLWTLPFGVFPGTPTALSIERLPADWRRPLLDLPTLTAEVDPTRPVFPRQLVASPAFVSAPDSQHIHRLVRFSLLGDQAMRVTDDPTLMPAHLLMTSAVPLAVANSAPLLRLTIPDPFEQLRVIRLANSPADADAPEVSQTRPPLPQLPPASP